MKKFIPAEQIFQKKLWSMVCAEPDIKGRIRLQKTRFLVRKNVFDFTVTIERGDKLNV